MKDHWQDFKARWHLLTAPLRPNDEVVQAIVEAVGPHVSNVLLLGVTPELVRAFTHLEAVDKSSQMIETLWQPEVATQTVREANWLDMDDRYGKYSAIVGDCSMNALQTTDEIAGLLRMVRDHLTEDGVFACRVFARPEKPIVEADLLQAIDRGTHGNFHAFKWQIAMSLAGEFGPAVRAVNILKRFNRLFGDRQQLAVKTGWARDTIDTVDVYQQSDMAISFPNRQEFEQLFTTNLGAFEWLECGTYDLAACCPIVVASPA